MTTDPQERQAAAAEQTAKIASFWSTVVIVGAGLLIIAWVLAQQT